MRHRKQGRKFHRKKGERAAFIRGLVSNLVRRGFMQTTVARAKEVRPVVERSVTLAKKGTLHARRLLISRWGSPLVADKLIGEYAPKYASRPGGYLRITQLATPRKRDSAPLARIEFV